MSQTVPTGNCYIPSDPFAAYADSFDLSLLPSSNDGEVPLSPQSELFLSPSSTTTNTISTTGITTTTSETSLPLSQSPLLSLDYIPTTIYHEQAIKIEKPWDQEDTITNTNNYNNNNSNCNNNKTNTITDISCDNNNLTQQQQSSVLTLATPDTSILLQQLQKQYQFYPSPLPSPPQDSPASVVPSISTAPPATLIYPPSPCPSIEQNFHNFSIKQEYHILPPSPPESSGAPSPACSDIKSEPETDTESTFIDFNSLLKKSINFVETSTSPPPKSIKPPHNSPVQQQQSQQQQQINKKPAQDHQLLREYLQDTSFQRKHNLKPLALESLIGGLGARGDIEPVISLALEHAKRDAQATCAILKISPGEFSFIF